MSPANVTLMDRGELLDLLNTLLEAERAGARGVGEMGRKASAAGTMHDALCDVARDEAQFCAMLTRHIERLGGEPSTDTGAFIDTLLAIDDINEQLVMLNRGQGWVARKLSDALPRIDDPILRADLEDMLEVHERNIERCNRLAG